MSNILIGCLGNRLHQNFSPSLRRLQEVTSMAFAHWVITKCSCNFSFTTDHEYAKTQLPGTQLLLHQLDLQFPIYMALVQPSHPKDHNSMMIGPAISFLALVQLWLSKDDNFHSKILPQAPVYHESLQKHISDSRMSQGASSTLVNPVDTIKSLVTKHLYLE